MFVDEGEAMPRIAGLRRVTGKNRRYAAALLGVFEARSNRGVLATDRTGKVETPRGILVEPLSRRELELLPLLAEGLSNQEIARKLHISLDTVKVHLKHIYGKLEVSSPALRGGAGEEVEIVGGIEVSRQKVTGESMRTWS